jgi:hypothetical protein
MGGPTYRISAISRRVATVLVCVLVALLAFGVYLGTLSPSITWEHNGADSGDLATAVAVGGVPHPSGYPTYLVVAELFRRLPWGDVAYRLGLLSAAASALAAALISAIAMEGLPPENGMALRSAVGAAAGLLFAFSPLVWSQAVIPEVYGLHALACCAILALALRARTSTRPAAIFVCFLALGLGLGNHLSVALLLPALLSLTWDRLRADARTYVIGGTAGLALGLAVYVLLPLRAASGPPVNWGGATSLPGFAWLVSGRTYRDLLFAVPWAQVPARLIVVLRVFVVSSNGLGLPLAVLGLADLYARDRKLAMASLYGVAAFSAYAIGYNTIDSYVYLVPAMAILAIWIAAGLGVAMRAGRRHLAAYPVLRTVLAAVILCLGLSGAPWRWSRLDLYADSEALDYGLAVVRAAVPNALLVVSGDAHTFAVWYARYALNERDDVVVVNDSLLAFDWYRRALEVTHPEPASLPADLEHLLADYLPSRPVELTDRPGHVPAGYCLVAAGPLFRVVSTTEGEGLCRSDS